jgi:DNA repair ATPase RecN
MQTDQQIAEERARINTLDSSLDAKRTPYLKNQLRFAGHMLDDALAALDHASKAEGNYVSMWIDFAEMNIQNANQRRQKVQDVVNKYGGPENIVEGGS